MHCITLIDGLTLLTRDTLNLLLNLLLNCVYLLTRLTVLNTITALVLVAVFERLLLLEHCTLLGLLDKQLQLRREGPLLQLSGRLAAHMQVGGQPERTCHHAGRGLLRM
jgi:hypothetical protein